MVKSPGGQQPGNVLYGKESLACAGDRLRTGIQLTERRDPVPDFFDTFTEYVEFCVDYRAKLAQIVKLTATWLPQQVRCIRAVICRCKVQQPSSMRLTETVRKTGGQGVLPCHCMHIAALSSQHATHSGAGGGLGTAQRSAAAVCA